MTNKELITILREGKDFELLEPFHFYFDGKSDSLMGLKSEVMLYDGRVCIPIPKGFRTDFGSVPLLFQSLISPIGKPTKAYVLHDYLCVLANNGDIARKKADEVFLDAMRILGVGRFKRILIYGGVRFYAFLKDFLKAFKRRFNG